MKFQLLFLAVLLTLASSNVEAQTLGESVVAGNEDGANMVTDSMDDSTAASGAMTISSPTPDTNPAGHSGLNASSSSAEPTGMSSADKYTMDSSTDASDDAHSDDSSSTDDSTSDDSSSSTVDAATSAASASGSSDASRAVLTAGASLLAVAVAAML